MTIFTDSGLTNIASIIRGNVSFRSGTWTAGPGAALTVIPGGGTAILAAGVTIRTIESQTATPPTVAYTATPGNPNLLITPFSTEDSGNYWMFVRHGKGQ